MGRTDEVQFMLECGKAWQSRGARITWQSGWESRGNGLQGNYEGCIVHHTASASSAARPNPALSVLLNGRPDLQGPLCNVTGPWCADGDPWLHVIAAYPANHAGASGGRSMGPLPVTSLFNPRVLGLEIDYAGSSPMTGGQYRAAAIFARGVCDVLGRSTEYARAHAESSVTGKWDPGYASGRTIDMAAFRRDAATLQGDDMPLTDDDIRRIYDYGVQRVDAAGNPDGRWINLKTFLAWDDAKIGRILDLIQGYGVRVERMDEGEHGGWSYGTLIKNIEAIVAGLQQGSGTAAASQPVSVDAQSVAAALSADPRFVEAIAEATAQKIATRLAS